MNRTKLKYRSSRGKLIQKLDDIFRQIIRLHRGHTCEICGRQETSLAFPLSIFHILPKGKYPRMRFHSQNVLLACFSPFQNKTYCHNAWHECCAHEREYKKVEEGIVRLLGKEYWDELLKLDAIQPKHNKVYLNMLLAGYKIELKEGPERRNHDKR